jgi:hypothetical protein
LYNREEKRGEVGDEDQQRVFRLLGPLGKLHNIVVYIYSSASRTKEFIDLVIRMVPLDNRTRWNSWYRMLVIANNKSGPIDLYTKRYFSLLQADYLNPHN